MAKGKDHTKKDPSKIGVFAIGIRHRASGKIPTCYIQQNESGRRAHPSAEITVTPGRIMVSGGGGYITQTHGQYGFHRR